MTTPVKVLVVDDSAFARSLLARVLGAHPRIDVVGTARDGHDALAKIAELTPDVVTLDLSMPHLDGLGVLRALAGGPRPRVVVVSISSIDTELGADALALGAVDVIAKPTALASQRLAEIGDALVARVLAIGDNLVPGPAARPDARTSQRVPRLPAELVVVGASTGGPQALTRLLGNLPVTLRAPVAIALHIPVGYTEAMAARLDRTSPLHIVEASDGLVLVPGVVALARGGMHLRVVREAGVLRAVLGPPTSRPFAPSVDELFLSGAAASGARCLGVVLTGMGSDGVEGARSIAAAGGQLLVEDASTSVVYGMPRSVRDAEPSAVSIPLHDMASEITLRV